jgi:hypothetical protein
MAVAWSLPGAAIVTSIAFSAERAPTSRRDADRAAARNAEGVYRPGNRSARPFFRITRRRCDVAAALTCAKGVKALAELPVAKIARRFM